MNSYWYRNLVSTIAISLLTMLTAVSCGGQAASSTTPPPTPSYQLVWSDEFSGADGSAPDATKWAIQTGGGGWGNNELESYTARPANVQVSGGNLVITAVKEDYTGTDGIARHYTSARHADQGIVLAAVRAVRGANQDSEGTRNVAGVLDAGQQHRHGRLAGLRRDRHHGEHRQGAFDRPWNAACTGVSAGRVYGSIHLAERQSLADGFQCSQPNGIRNKFACTWTDALRDGYEGRIATAELVAFDSQPFFVLLNLAVGGRWPGDPDTTTQFPQQMLVDYVRVYQKEVATGDLQHLAVRCEPLFISIVGHAWVDSSVVAGSPLIGSCLSNMAKATAKTALMPTVLVRCRADDFRSERATLTDSLSYRNVKFGARIFVRFLGLRWLRNQLVSMSDSGDPGIWGGLLCRKRYIEEILIDASSNLEAIVNLGAGLDTRTYRLLALSDLPVWEVEQQEIIEAKRKRLNEILGKLPSNVKLVAIDFDHKDVGEVLASHGYQLATGQASLGRSNSVSYGAGRAEDVRVSCESCNG